MFSYTTHIHTLFQTSYQIALNDIGLDGITKQPIFKRNAIQEQRVLVQREF